MNAQFNNWAELAYVTQQEIKDEDTVVSLETKLLTDVVRSLASLDEKITTLYATAPRLNIEYTQHVKIIKELDRNLEEAVLLTLTHTLAAGYTPEKTAVLAAAGEAEVSRTKLTDIEITELADKAILRTVRGETIFTELFKIAKAHNYDIGTLCSNLIEGLVYS